MTLLRILDRWLDRFYGWCGYVAAVLLVCLAGLIAASIATRLLGVYVAGLTEYSGYAMAGASFLAFAYTFRENGHIRVAIMLSALHGRRRWGLQLWCLLAASAISAYFAFYFVRMARVSWRLGDVSEGAAATPLWIPQSVVAFGAVVLAVCIFHHLVRFVIGGRSNDREKTIASVSEP
jgi:TRAP-type mannitol/chloroaromatic compound transport system permease small subunit